MSINNTSTKLIELDAAISIIKRGQYFLFQKRNRDPYCNYLGLIGGKIEAGESLEEAVKREIYEESGLSIKRLFHLGKVVETLHDEQSTTKVNLIIFQAITKGVPISNEEGVLLWIDIDQFKKWKQKFIPTDWIIVEKVVNGGLKNFQITVNNLSNTYEVVKAR